MIFGINSASDNGNVTAQKASTKPVSQNKVVTIPLAQQKWVASSINPNDYTTVNGLRKRFNISEFSLHKLPQDLIDSNGGAGSARINNQEVTLDELTLFESKTENYYGSVGIKHTKNGDEIYIHECRNGRNTISKYVNGELKSVERTSQSGIMPWC